MRNGSGVFRTLFVVFVLMTFAVALASTATAQTEANPVTTAAKRIFTSDQPNLIAAAEAMPEDKYGYKPTAQQMTFGHLIEHIANSNDFLCSKLSGQPASEGKVSEKDGKAKLVSAVRQSFDYCSGVLNKLTDAQLAEPAELFGGMKGTKATALLYLVSGMADHYGAQAMYLRLNGLTPPTAKKKE